MAHWARGRSTRTVCSQWEGAFVVPLLFTFGIEECGLHIIVVAKLQDFCLAFNLTNKMSSFMSRNMSIPQIDYNFLVEEALIKATNNIDKNCGKCDKSMKLMISAMKKFEHLHNPTSSTLTPFVHQMFDF